MNLTSWQLLQLALSITALILAGHLAIRTRAIEVRSIVDSKIAADLFLILLAVFTALLIIAAATQPNRSCDILNWSLLMTWLGLGASCALSLRYSRSIRATLFTLFLGIPLAWLVYIVKSQEAIEIFKTYSEYNGMVIDGKPAWVTLLEFHILRQPPFLCSENDVECIDLLLMIKNFRGVLLI